MNFDYIRPAGSIFQAHESLEKLNLHKRANEENFATAMALLQARRHEDHVKGLTILWALASSGDALACHRIADAIEAHILRLTESGRLPERLSHRYREIARVWRELPKPDLPPTDDHDRAADEPPQDFAPEIEPAGHVVVERLGDDRSETGSRLSARYADMVGRPLRRRGLSPSPDAFRSAFLDSFPWARETSAVLERSFRMARRTGSDRVLTKPLLLVGEPGLGKTSSAMKIGALLGRHTVKVAAAGSADSAALAAVARDWSTARPCLPVIAMHESQSCDPCIVIDELDKGVRVGGQNGSVAGALINMLDHPTRYHDSCLLAEIDLSHILFVATANSIEPIPPALRDRFTIIRLERPSVEHLGRIVAGMRREIAAELGIEEFALPEIDGIGMAAIETFFRSNRGSLRGLRRAVEAVVEEAFDRERAMPM